MFPNLPILLLIMFCLCVEAIAQEAPYDEYPPAEPPYYRVRYESSKEPGELIFAVNYTMWIPADVKTLRGIIVHQHGCGEGSCRSGLTGAYDLHWQALARKHQCALLAPAYEQPQNADCQMWCDPRNGSSATFDRALVDLGEIAGHQELISLPLALWGHSGGGHWCGGIVLTQPQRVAAAWLRSGVPLFKTNPDRPSIKPHTLPKAALGIPMMCNLGTKEGVSVKDGRFSKVWPANQEFFKEVRGNGGLLGIAIDPLTSHECGNSRYLAIPWLDQCLTLRLPEQPGQQLREISSKGCWLGDPINLVAKPRSEFAGDEFQASWLPNETMAKAWLQFCKDTRVVDMTPPPAPGGAVVEGKKITWNAQADLQSGIAKFKILRDGKLLVEVSSAKKNRFGRQLFQNLQYSDTPVQPLSKMEYFDQTGTRAASYSVITVNTAGQESKPTEAIRRSSAQ